MLDDGWFAAAGTTGPGSATGPSTRRSGPRASVHWSRTCGAWAWTSGCGSSPRWSTSTPTWPASTPTGSCAGAPRCPPSGATSRSSTCRCRRRTPTCATRCWRCWRSTTSPSSSGTTTGTWSTSRTPAGPPVHGQTLAFYRLLDELRAAHPALEIETCASGGGRVDLGVLTRTDRVWPSDTIDAARAAADPALDLARRAARDDGRPPGRSACPHHRAHAPTSASGRRRP